MLLRDPANRKLASTGDASLLVRAHAGALGGNWRRPCRSTRVAVCLGGAGLGGSAFVPLRIFCIVRCDDP